MFVGLYAKYPLLLSDFNENLNFLDKFSKNAQISNFMKIHSVGAELFHTEIHDKDNSSFLQFSEHT